MLTSLCKYKDINKPSAFSYLADICPHMFSKYFGEIILFFFFFLLETPSQFSSLNLAIGRISIKSLI